MGASLWGEDDGGSPPVSVQGPLRLYLFILLVDPWPNLPPALLWSGWVASLLLLNRGGGGHQRFRLVNSDSVGEWRDARNRWHLFCILFFFPLLFFLLVLPGLSPRRCCCMCGQWEQSNCLEYRDLSTLFLLSPSPRAAVAVIKVLVAINPSVVSMENEGKYLARSCASGLGVCVWGGEGGGKKSMLTASCISF